MGRPRQCQPHGWLELRRDGKIQRALRRRRRPALRSARGRDGSVINNNSAKIIALRESDESLDEGYVAAVARVFWYGNTRLLGVNISSLRKRGPLVALESREDHRSRLVALQRGVPILVLGDGPATERHAVVRLHRAVAIHGYVDDSRRAGGTQ